MSQIIWKGSTEIQEQPRSPRIVKSPNGDVVTQTFRGPFERLKAIMPSLGHRSPDFEGLYVDQVSVIPDGAGIDGPGTLEVVYAPITERVELEWLQLDDQIENHWMFTTDGPNPIDKDDRETLREWRAAADGDARALTYARMTANARAVVVYLAQGIESYRIFRPVVRITAESYLRPKASRAGVIALLPANAADIINASSYFWLVTTDQVTSDGIRGKWRRVREYSGFDYIDNHIYDPESSAPSSP